MCNADATFTLTRGALDAVSLGKAGFDEEIAAGNIKVQGDGNKLGELLDTFEGKFNIVTL